VGWFKKIRRRVKRAVKNPSRALRRVSRVSRKVARLSARGARFTARKTGNSARLSMFRVDRLAKNPKRFFRKVGSDIVTDTATKFRNLERFEKLKSLPLRLRKISNLRQLATKVTAKDAAASFRSRFTPGKLQAAVRRRVAGAANASQSFRQRTARLPSRRFSSAAQSFRQRADSARAQTAAGGSPRFQPFNRGTSRSLRDTRGRRTLQATRNPNAFNASSNVTRAIGGGFGGTMIVEADKPATDPIGILTAIFKALFRAIGLA